MPKRVYIETTIPSYLTARPARDLLQAARQQLTHDWWDEKRGDYDLCTSQIVLDEAAAGNSDAARRRMILLEDLPILETIEEVDEVAEAILISGLLPAKAGRDAAHIAISAVHGVEFLLTWNCRHIANAAIMRELSAIVSARGHELPVLCTPEELLGR